MGVFQLPDSVDGDAAGCLVYSFVCLIANSILVWLIWTHHERTSYVAYISYFTCLATVSSIVQQLYDYTLWREIMIEQFYYGKAHANDAETQYQRGIMGLKLALSYIRQFCFIVESTLVLFFSMSLAATVYGWWAKRPQRLRKLSTIGRIVPIALALLSTILLQLEFTHKSFTIYFLIANAQLVLSLAGSCIFLLMILFKYVQTRRQLKTWQSIQYGQPGSTVTSVGKSAHSRRSRTFSGAGKPSATFDQWLVIRLSIAFLTLCVFEWTNIAPRFKAKGHIVESVNETDPDLSEKRAMSTVTGYLSGVSPSLLAFIVFGTTKTFQRKMYTTFLPRALRDKIAGRRHPHDGNDDDFACRHAEGRLPFSSSASASAAGSSFARASTLVLGAPPPRLDTKSIGSTSAPTTPRTPRRSSLRPPDRASFLLPIQEPFPPQKGATTATIEEADSEAAQMPHHRRSQIGVAVSGTPEPLLEEPKPILLPSRSRGRRATFGTVGTFFRDDSVESLSHHHHHYQQEQQSIPLSRFNVSKHSTDPNNDNEGECGSHDWDEPQMAKGIRQIDGQTDSFASTTTVWSDGERVSGDHRALGRTRFGSVS